jgi:hypothetical protein
MELVNLLTLDSLIYRNILLSKLCLVECDKLLELLNKAARRGTPMSSFYMFVLSHRLHY